MNLNVIVASWVAFIVGVLVGLLITNMIRRAAEIGAALNQEGGSNE